jgi:hypothetical protein
MMGADGINVAKISRQMRQLGLHVYPRSYQRWSIKTAALCLRSWTRGGWPCASSTLALAHS